MIQGIEEINLPKYATLNKATITMQNMGDQTLEATFSIDRDVTPDFSEDWVLKFRGVEFIHPLKSPHASKDKAKFNPEYSLTFYHKGIYELKRKFFFSLPPVESSTAVPDKYEASLALNLVDFIDAFKKVLAYYYGDYFTLDFNTEPTKPYDDEKISVSISYTKMWDLLSSLYNNYKVSWWIEPKFTEEGYVIKVGYDRSKLAHQFEYGFDGGLLKIERQVQSPDIINIMLGRGGTKNLPYRYFKKRAEDSGGGGTESTFAPDPDWIPELENIPFDGLRDINFRYWIQGWKDKHYQYDSETGDLSDVGDHKAGERRYAVDEHWAYDMGFTAKTFDPVEYVKDDASIAKYGELWGGLSKVEDIYPSIQGVFLPAQGNIPAQGRADQIVAVQQIDQDYEDDIKRNPTVINTDLTFEDTFKASLSFYNGAYYNFNQVSINTFTVSEGFTASVEASYALTAHIGKDGKTKDVTSTVSLVDGIFQLYVVNAETGEELPHAALIPSGTYRLGVRGQAHCSYASRADVAATFALTNIRMTETILPETKADLNSFDIWVKNIWQSERLWLADEERYESDVEYSKRVWQPILGNHLGDEAAVVFSSGWLSINEDYEFPLVARYPVFDDSKSIICKDEDGNDITVQSHWRIRLRRSDAEYDATGKYLPNELINAESGDYFFFIGVDMPHWYVVKAEIRLNAYKQQQTDDVSEINPTWAIELSKTRIGSPYAGETTALINQLGVGKDVDLYSKWFVSDPMFKDEGETYTTTIQSLTFKYEAPKQGAPGLLPSVSITLADKPMSTASSVSLLQGSVDALTSRINSMSAPYVLDVIKSADEVTAETDYNVYSAKRAKRTQLSSQTDDEADGHIKFNQGLTSEDLARLRKGSIFGQSFVSGDMGIGGQIDENADAELNSLKLRSWLEVPELRFNRADVLMGDQWNAAGGGIVESVVIDTDANGNLLRTGTITLKLEQGEIGAIAVDDICKGYYHDFYNESNNATADADDSKGNTEFSGFCTVYFYITEILSSDGVNKKFRFMLRNESENWQHSFYPFEGMHFVCYGNFSDADRQKSAYQTRSYTRYLKGVDDWEFNLQNIAMQFGDLSNLQVFNLDMRGYSAYLQNIYMTGTIEKVKIEAPAELQITTNTGDTFIADGETLTLTCEVRKAWLDLTTEVQSWSIERYSGNAAADAVWNSSHQMTSPTFTLTQEDIGATILNANTLFSITANGDEWTATKTIAVRTLRLPSTLSMRFISEYGENDTFISYGDKVKFYAVIEDALRNDYTSEYDQWQIERHNGDTAADLASDGVWNVTRAAITSSGVFSLEWSDQHDDLQSERATFIVTAQKGSSLATTLTGILNI